MAERTSATDAGPTHRKRKVWRRAGVAVLAVAVLLAVALTFLPTPIARHLVSRQLDALGIGYSGVETVDVNLWRGRVRLGPVQFSVGEGDPGQLAYVEVVVRYLPLLSQRAAANDVILSGIDLTLERGEGGGFELNGVRLDALAPDVSASEPADESPPADPWGTGLASLTLENSRFLLREGEGRTLEVGIERLTLADFFTWTPEQPGRFDLVADVNGIDVTVNGEARPFAERITVTATSKVAGITPDRISRYTGPLGVQRAEGEVSLDFAHEVEIGSDGTVTGSAMGQSTLEGLALALADDQWLEVPDGGLRAELTYEASLATVAGTVRGVIDVDATALRGKPSGDTEFAFERMTGKFEALEVELRAADDVLMTAQPEIAVDGIHFDGPIRISVDEILNVLVLLQSLTAPNAPAATGLEAYAENRAELPRSTIDIQRVESRLDRLEFESAAGVVTLALAGGNALRKAAVVSGDREIDAEELDLQIRALDLRSGAGELDVQAALRSRLGGGRSTSSLGEAVAQYVEADLGNVSLQLAGESIKLQASGEAGGGGVTATVLAQEHLPETRASVGELEVSLSEASLTAAPGRLGGSGAAKLAVRTVEMTAGGGDLGALKFDTLAIAGVTADDSPSIGVEEITLSRLDAMLARELVRSLLGNDGDGEADRAAPAPGDAARATDAAVLLQVQQALGARGFDAGTPDGVMGPRTRSAIEAFQQANEMDVDGEVSGELLAALGISDMPEWAAGEVLPGPGVRLGRLALTDGPRVRYLDRQAKPQVEVNTVFERFELRDLDTADRSKRATVDMGAVVNEFTRVTLAGRASGFTASTDLELEAHLDDLALPPFSPYAAEFAGLNVKTGQLTTLVEAAAQAGDLTGTVEVALDDVEFEPLSEEDAARLEETTGMPIGLAVSLLKDPQGNIDLALPIGGTVQSPSVNIGSAIRKAVGGVLGRVFPPTAIARMMKSGKGAVIDFEPLPFEVGSAAFAAGAREAGERVASLLLERPQLEVNVCGRVTAADVDAMAAPSPAEGGEGGTGAADGATSAAAAGAGAGGGTSGEGRTAGAAFGGALTERARQLLDELAAARTRVARQLFSDELGIDRRRVGECRAVVDPEDPGPPRAEVSL